MDWTSLGVGLAFFLVFEGILPFLSPALLKKTYVNVTQLPDQGIRVAGFVSMMLGALLLAWLRSTP